MGCGPRCREASGKRYASASTSDDDSDDLTLTYAFAVDGTTVQSGSSNTLDGSTYFDSGETVTVTVTATDGEDSDSGTASITGWCRARRFSRRCTAVAARSTGGGATSLARSGQLPQYSHRVV